MDPQERRRQILQRSGEIFATKGISATTVREIADACGVYSGTLYHYFPSKDAIVTEIIRVYVDELYEKCSEVIGQGLPPIERLEVPSWSRSTPPRTTVTRPRSGRSRRTTCAIRCSRPASTTRAISRRRYGCSASRRRRRRAISAATSSPPPSTS